MSRSAPARPLLTACVFIAVVWRLIAAPASGAENTCAYPDVDRRLDAIVRGEAAGVGPVPGVALAILHNDDALTTAAAGCARFDADGATCATPMSEDTKFRVASISKMAVAFAVLSLVEEGALDLERDVSDYLGFSFRNPTYPDKKITLRHLLAHTGGVRDPEEYWVAAPGSFRALLDGLGESLFADDGPPGAYFTYANINYGIVAGAMERATGMRFDEIMTDRIAAPLGLDIGFNWSGVSTEARANAATLYRRRDAVWVAQTDHLDILNAEGPYFLAEHGLDRDAYLENYQPGDNPTLFSPQGGMRASVIDLARLVRLLGPGEPYAKAGEALWRYESAAPNGDPFDGLMTAYGLGTHTASGAMLAGRNFVGHSGEAYGLLSGAWHAKDGGVSLAYAVTGSPENVVPGDQSGFTRVEEALIELAVDFVDACAVDARE